MIFLEKIFGKKTPQKLTDNQIAWQNAKNQGLAKIEIGKKSSDFSIQTSDDKTRSLHGQHGAINDEIALANYRKNAIDFNDQSQQRAALTEAYFNDATHTDSESELYYRALSSSAGTDETRNQEFHNMIHFLKTTEAEIIEVARYYGCDYFVNVAWTTLNYRFKKFVGNSPEGSPKKKVLIATSAVDNYARRGLAVRRYTQEKSIIAFQHQSVNKHVKLVEGYQKPQAGFTGEELNFLYFWYTQVYTP